MIMAKVNLETVKNQLKSQQENEGQQQPPQLPAERTPAQAVGDYLKAISPTIAKVLPAHMTPDRMARIALGEIRKNPKLLQCSVESLGAAVMQAATLGLEPSTLGHCYFVPFNRKVKNGKRTEYVKDVQFIIGYKGLIDLAWRSGGLVSIVAHEVRENDHFDFAYGLNERLEHIPADGKRGAVIKYYAYAKMKGGGHVFLVKTRNEILEHAFQHSKQIYEGKLTGPWKDHFDSMAKKTIIRELMKYLPLSVEIAQHIDSDEKIVRGMKEVKDAHENIFDLEAADTSGNEGPAENAEKEQQEAPETPESINIPADETGSEVVSGDDSKEDQPGKEEE